MAAPPLSMLLRGALPPNTSYKTLLPLPLGTLPMSALPHGMQLPSVLQFGAKVVFYYGSRKNGLLISVLQGSRLNRLLSQCLASAAVKIKKSPRRFFFCALLVAVLPAEMPRQPIYCV